ncbi:MAG: hypothetical protein JSV04_08850 [Candidatus Heimdallarchaeota archaeon]|nr:MAG: hypothetical protein JSV04_08850 [Candidatus Heimdallarchaeota archaeon]
MTSPSLKEKFDLTLSLLSDTAETLQSSVDLIQSNTRSFQHQVMKQMQEGYSRNHMNALMAFTQIFSRMNTHVQEVNEFTTGTGTLTGLLNSFETNLSKIEKYLNEIHDTVLKLSQIVNQYKETIQQLTDDFLDEETAKIEPNRPLETIIKEQEQLERKLKEFKYWGKVMRRKLSWKADED